jgi:predicted permease
MRWWKRKQGEHDLERELQADLELEAREQQERGLPAEEARYAARRALGNAAILKEDVREAWGWLFVDRLQQDLCYAWRGMRKSPGFTAAAMLSLALGIGVNTTMFSLVNALMLRGLPVEKPEELFDVVLPDREHAGYFGFSYPLFEALRDHTTTLAGILAVAEAAMSVTADGQAEIVPGGGMFASGRYFSTLGIKAVIGRTFTPADDEASATNPVAVISYSYWKRRFALDPRVIGKAILVNGQPMTIIGVTPPGFFSVAIGAATEITLPFSAYTLLNRGSTHLTERQRWWLRVMARVKPGISADQAKADLNVAFQQYLAEPASKEQQRDFAGRRIEFRPGAQGIGGQDAGVRMSMLVLAGVVGLVLAIACANVTNLLLARGVARQREIALRLSLGAARSRLVRQLLTESVMLAAMGGAAGLLVAYWGTQGVGRLLHHGPGPLPIDLAPDGRALAFTAAVALLTGILFGLMPALRSTRLDLTPVLKKGGAAGGRSRSRLRSGLVVAQVALSLVLLVVAGLFARSLQKLMEEDLGFHPEHVLLVSVNPKLIGYQGANMLQLYQHLLGRVEAAPGVRSASASLSAGIIGGGRWHNLMTVPGYTPKPGEKPGCGFVPVAAHFFGTVGIPVLLGRDFETQDTGRGSKVAAINETFARRYFGKQSPLGRSLGLGVKQNLGWFEIVAVVKDSKYGDIRDRSQPLVYFPLWQTPPPLVGAATIEVRTLGEPGVMTAAVRRELLAVEKDLPIGSVKTMSQQVAESLGIERTVALLAGLFGLLALALASVGLYGVLSYAVAWRTSEIGIRMALGAQRADVVRLILRNAMMLVALGAGLGLVGALAAGRAMASLLFRLSGADPVTVSTATLVLAAVGGLAGYLPARRASRVDPMAAVKYE